MEVSTECLSALCQGLTKKDQLFHSFSYVWNVP